MKKRVRLTESELRHMITESVRSVLNETRFDTEDNFPYLGCEKSRPGDIPPGDEDVYYPCDINPDVWDALQRGDFGDDDNKTDIMEKYITNTVRKVLNEEYQIEDIPTYDVFTENVSISEFDKILGSSLYDSNDKFVGKLSDLHFKYDPNTNNML